MSIGGASGPSGDLETRGTTEAEAPPEASAAEAPPAQPPPAAAPRLMGQDAAIGASALEGKLNAGPAAAAPVKPAPAAAADLLKIWKQQGLVPLDNEHAI